MLVSEFQVGVMHCAAWFFGGVGIGFFVWSWFASRDRQLVYLSEEEVIIKRPDANMVLVQVTPDVARRLVNTAAGEQEKASVEARNLYRGRPAFDR